MHKNRKAADSNQQAPMTAKDANVTSKRIPLALINIRDQRFSICQTLGAFTKGEGVKNMKPSPALSALAPNLAHATAWPNS